MKNRELLQDFDEVYRNFHQAVAIPDYPWLQKILEPWFYGFMSNSINNIQKHGMDFEMANLRVRSDKHEILKVELTHGLPLNRNQRHSWDSYDVSEGSLFGAKCTTYTLKNGPKHSFLDNMFVNYKPYNLAVTVSM